jgi:hypothetical protein
LASREFQSGNEPARRRLSGWQWLTAAVLVQALVLAMVGAMMLRHPDPSAGRAPYVTLSSETLRITGEAPIRAVFSDAMTIADLRSLLAGQGLTIVRGPTDAGVYTLVSADAQDSRRLEARIEALRADGRVRFVEP